MTRKDGRELVTEFPVTAMDMIDYVSADDIPEGGFGCKMDFPREDDEWMDDSA